MAFKEVTANNEERKETEFYTTSPKSKTGILLKQHDYIEGFLKWKHSKKEYDRVTKTEKTSWLYFIDMPEWDKSKALYGCGKLDYLMKQVELGDYIRITYLGKEVVEGYPQALHQFKLEVDKDRINTLANEIAEEDQEDPIPF